MTKEATETQEGEETRECSRCGEKETRPIPVIGHVHRLTKTDAKDATCSDDGNTAYWTCDQGESPCGRLFSDEEGIVEISLEEVTLPALGHNWDEGAITTAATCTADGVKTFTCKNDSTHTRTEVVPATGHDWGAATYEWAGDNSTVTAKRVCANDATHVETEEAAVASEVTKPATCEGKGETTYTAAFENEAFAAQVKTVEDVDALGHDYESVVTEPTCTEGGYTTYTCSRCGGSYTADKTDALGHAWGEWTVTKEATETQEGEETRECSRCGEKETRPIPVIGHVHRLTKTDAKDATCSEAGNTEYWTCDKGDDPCGKFFSDEAGKNEIEKDSWATPATGHKWSEPTWTWTGNDARGYSAATAKFVCANDSAHVESAKATISVKVKRATARNSGTITYTAKATGPDGTTYTAEKVVVVAPTLMKVTVKGKKVKASWAKNSQADGYYIHFGNCKASAKKAYTSTKGSAGTYVKKVKQNGYYKVFAKAYKMINGKTYVVSKSFAVHVRVGASAKANATKVVVSSSKKLTLAKGGKAKVKAKVKTKAGKTLLYKNHCAKVRFATTDKAIATVSKKGAIKAQGTGACTIYVVAPNGLRKAVKVTVR